MNKRRFLSIKSECGEEIFLTEGKSSKLALEEHKRNCMVCSPPPAPPKLERQSAIMIDAVSNEIVEERKTLF